MTSSEPAARGPLEGAARREPEHLVVGQITKVHGTKGELYIWPLTDDPEAVFAEGEELIVGDQEGELGAEPLHAAIERVRPFRGGVLVRFEGIEDRNAAEPFARRYVLLPAAAVRPPGEGELFYHQLLDLSVETVAGEPVGRVREVFDTEPAHLLEVKGAEKVHLIPFTQRIVKMVDLEAGRVVIDPPEGLLEL